MRELDISHAIIRANFVIGQGQRVGVIRHCGHGVADEPGRQRIVHPGVASRRHQQTEVSHFRIHSDNRSKIIGNVTHLPADLENALPRLFADADSVVPVI